MKNYNLVFFFLFSMLFACANPIIGTQEPANAIQVCSEKVKGIGDFSAEYMQDGHLYTTLAITDLVQLPIERQLTLSYYTQYPDIDPDYEATPVAIKYMLVPWKYAWRNNITGKLHSLHGGNSAYIKKRRENIGEALKETIKDPSLDWLSGLIIHAYGDSYAHTKYAYDSEYEHAYNVWLGHMWATLMRRSPDAIKRNAITEEKYLAYINDFYQDINLDAANDYEFKRFEAFVESYECTGGACPNFHAEYNNQDPEDNKIDLFRDCMNKSSRQLTPLEVSKAFELIDPLSKF